MNFIFKTFLINQLISVFWNTFLYKDFVWETGCGVYAWRQRFKPQFICRVGTVWRYIRIRLCFKPCLFRIDKWPAAGPSITSSEHGSGRYVVPYFWHIRTVVNWVQWFWVFSKNSDILSGNTFDIFRIDIKLLAIHYRIEYRTVHLYFTIQSCHRRWGHVWTRRWSVQPFPYSVILEVFLFMPSSVSYRFCCFTSNRLIITFTTTAKHHNYDDSRRRGRYGRRHSDVYHSIADVVHSNDLFTDVVITMKGIHNWLHIISDGVIGVNAQLIGGQL